MPQQSAVALTGLIWMKYSLDITPKNYNLMAVNAAMAVTGLYQLYRRYEYDREMKKIMEQSEGGGGAAESRHNSIKRDVDRFRRRTCNITHNDNILYREKCE